MELFATPTNPVPPNAIVSVARARDGVELRVARWTRRSSRGGVLIAMGRGECIEQYFDVVRALLARRFDVIAFDWRGQGGSARAPITTRLRGRWANFAAYQRDLLAIETQVLRAFVRRPWFALGHSMGGAVLLEQAHAGTSPFERLVLTAPLIDIPLQWRAAKENFVRAVDYAGFGGLPLPGMRRRRSANRLYAKNALTSDDQQFERLVGTFQTTPALVSPAPNIGWLADAFRLIDRFAEPRYAVSTTTPVLIIAGGADRIVDTAAIERFASYLKAGHCITLPDARHQIMMETETVRAQFWAAFDAFVPGETASAGDLGQASDAADRQSRLRRLVSRLRSGAIPSLSDQPSGARTTLAPPDQPAA